MKTRFCGAVLLTLCCSVTSHAMTCYITLVKDSCWTDYDVTVKIANAKTDKNMSSISVLQDHAWGRETFDCEPGDTLSLSASFQPAFWETDKNKTFPGQRYWKLPDHSEPGETGWNVTVCYPEYFANVPLPPNASSHCACDMSVIPKMEPK